VTWPPSSLLYRYAQHFAGRAARPPGRPAHTPPGVAPRFTWGRVRRVGGPARRGLGDTAAEHGAVTGTRHRTHTAARVPRAPVPVVWASQQ
jgi:hypothetical protein